MLGVRAVKPTPDWTATIVGRWQYGNAAPFPYGDDVTYRKAIAYLDGHGTIEDWGAGTGYARRFVQQSAYRAIDGSPSLEVDGVVDLRTYRSGGRLHPPAPRPRAQRGLAAHPRERAPVVPPAHGRSSSSRRSPPETHEIASWQGIPDLAFRKDELVAHFDGLAWREETVATNTEYLREHVFYLERPSALRRTA